MVCTGHRVRPSRLRSPTGVAWSVAKKPRNSAVDAYESLIARPSVKERIGNRGIGLYALASSLKYELVNLVVMWYIAGSGTSHMSFSGRKNIAPDVVNLTLKGYVLI